MKQLIILLFIPLFAYAPERKTKFMLRGHSEIIDVADIPTLDKVYDYIVDLGIKYPDIVIRQCILETGYLSSQVFKENHNLFGMREAKVRPTTAIGTNRSHAVYNHWRDSVYDYLLWQLYMEEIGWLDTSSEENYYYSLDMFYATASAYSYNLKRL